MQILKENDILIVQSIKHQDKNTFDEIMAAKSDENSEYKKLKIEINIYDSEVDYLIQTLNVYAYEFSSDEIRYIHSQHNNDPGALDISSIEFNTEKILRKYNYSSGKFRVKYKFYEDILGYWYGSTPNSPQVTTQDGRNVFISKISPSRQEISIGYSDDSVLESFLSLSDYFPQYSLKFVFNKFINFGRNKLYLALNAKNEYNDTTKENSLIVKLYEPLPAEYDVNSKFWMVLLYSDEIQDEISLYDTQGQGGINIIKPPNFSNMSNRITKPSSKYTSYNDLMLYKKDYDLSDIYESNTPDNSNLYGIDLNIDYSYFKNFVHFSSATQLIQNFRNKLELLENYNYEINAIVPTGSFASSSSLYWESQRNELFSKFTKFEKFMYFESGSYFTSSAITPSTLPNYTQSPYSSFIRTDENTGNLLIDSTYPKQSVPVVSGRDATSLYTIVPTTSSIAISWFDIMYSSSMQFDWNNRDWLINTVPEYIRLDTDANKDYLTFINMIGEFYDNIWTYVENYYRLIKRENHIKDGMPNELIWDVLRNDGITLNNSNEAVDLNVYFSGLNISGDSSQYTASLMKAEKDITYEVWNRISNNLPYLYKSKGTKRSIQSLFNCYGIPTNYISIIEYGGPNIGSYSDTSISGTFSDRYQFEVEDFTTIVNVHPTQYISVPWVTSSYNNLVPSSIEFKFNTKYDVSKQILIEKSSTNADSGSFAIILNKSQFPNRGFLTFAMYSGSEASSSSTKHWPFYNGNTYSVLLKQNSPKSYTLTVKKYDDSLQKITVTDSVVLNTSFTDDRIYNTPGIMTIGASTAGASGSFDEFRLWSEKITDNVFDWHTKYSSATNGNSLLSSLDTLVFRLSFNDAQDLGTNRYLPNEGYASASYATAAMASNNFTPLTLYPYNYTPIDRYNLVSTMYSAPSIMNSEKIRIENNQITQSIILPDNYNVYPLRMPTNSGYENKIFNKFNSKYDNIIGEQSPYDNTDIDNNTLLIAFTPMQLINNDIIAFFGGDVSLFNEFGDPANYYSVSYPSLDNLKRKYIQNTKNHINFFEYVSFIRMYKQSVLEQIREFVPINTSLIMGTVYEQSILNRNKIKLINQEIGTNLKQRNAIIEIPEINSPTGFLLSNISTKVGAISKLKISSDIQNYILKLILHDEVRIGASKISYDLQMPMNKIDINASNMINILELSLRQKTHINVTKISYDLQIPMNKTDINASNVVLYDGYILNPEYQISGKYNNYFSLCEYRFNPWKFKDYLSLSCNKSSNTHYRYINSITINWSGESADRQPAIEINKNSGNQLRVNFNDNPKLIVQ
jgi:hypothetical protein